jgi:predicted component of type VI protein secretion system
LAACVAKKADGYYLTALKEKTVKLNGANLMDQDQVPLKEGDLVDVGNLKLMFFLQDNS